MDILLAPNEDAAVSKKWSKRITGARDLMSNEYAEMLRREKRKKEEAEEKQAKKEEREKKKKEREQKKIERQSSRAARGHCRGRGWGRGRGKMNV